MKLSKRERKGICNAFKKAKPFLWNGQGDRFSIKRKDNARGICLALEKSKAAYFLIAQSIVMDRLDGHPYVENYLRTKVKGIQKSHLTEENFQIFRHRWLDALIVEFSDYSLSSGWFGFR